MPKPTRAQLAEGPTRTVEDVAGMKSSGMVSSQWNAAVRMQCAVRDAVDRPVSLEQAFEYSARLFKCPEFKIAKMIAVFRLEFDQDVRDRQREHDEEEKRIRDNAGKS